MTLLARLRHWFRHVFRRAKVERELAAELQFHLEQEARGHRRDGLATADAGAAALRDFGGVAQVAEECRDAWGVRLLDQVRQDTAYAWRGLGRNPGFSAAVLLTLAIGVGASTTMFSVVHAVLLRPLPYREPDRLVALWSEAPARGVTRAPSGYATIADWRKASHTLRAIAAYDPGSVIITDARGDTRRVTAVPASASLFEALGVAPLLGRTFTAGEADRGDAVVVLSYAAWQKYFAGEPGVLGRTLTLDNRPVQIIGVMPPDFYFTQKSDDGLWLPESLARDWADSRTHRGTGSWQAVARLADGVTLDEARAELAGIARGLAQAYPEANTGLGVRLVPLPLDLTGRPLQLALLVLTAAVTAVLLIACSNVANLLLARGAARQREFAVREALGAGRGRLVRQLLAECAVFALLAAAAGSALAWGALQGVKAFGFTNIPRLDEIRLDPATLAFAVALSVGSAVLAGLMPALRTTRGGPMTVLRGARGMSAGGGARRWRALLVVTEFALALVLLIGASLLLRSFVRLNAVDTGFHAPRVLVVGLQFPSTRPEEEAAVFATRLLERVRALPGVTTAGIGEELLQGGAYEQAVTVEGAAAADPAVARTPLRIDAVTPDYFRALGVALKSGRFFDTHDDATAPGVALVNETFARRFWPGGNAVGRRFRPGAAGATGPWLAVVGVVADVQREGPDRAPVAQAYWPLAQHPSRPMNLVVATPLEPATLAPAVRGVIAEVDRTVPVGGNTTLRAELAGRLAPRAFNLSLIGAFAVIALTLAGIGIFGLMNYTVAHRTPEIGIRVALGAQPGNVMRMVLGDGLRLVLVGTAAGAVASALLMHGLGSMLYGISPLDPLSFIGAAGLLIAIALLACYLPTRRALAVSPVTALRAD